MNNKINYFSSNISDWNSKINWKELKQLEYIASCEKTELKKHTKKELTKLYDVLLKQKKEYVSRKNKNDYILRLQKKVLLKLKLVIWKYIDKYHKVKKYRRIKLHNITKKKYSILKLDKKISFDKESLLNNNTIEISRKTNFSRTNRYIWQLFYKYWNKKIPLEKLEQLKDMYFQSFYNEFFISKDKINKPLLKSVQEYYIYKKQWDNIFENNLWLFLSKDLAKQFEILWYVESYFWKNNYNKIAKWPFQFTENTWNTYNLVDKKWHILINDYRNDPLKSADAASKHLRDLFFSILIKRNKLEKNDVLEYKRIKIKKWDTFFWLSRKYNVNISVIVWFNKIMWKNIKKLSIWQEIYIPTKLKSLQSKINTENIAFVLSIYNWWLYNRLRLKNVDTMNGYINILNKIYNNYKYVILRSKSSNSLLSWVNKVNKMYFKKWKWLFTNKWKWIQKLRYKSLNYKKRFILNHIQEIILQQVSYFFKFTGAVKFFNYLEKNKNILKFKWLVFDKISRKIDLEHDNLADYLYMNNIKFDFDKEWYISINTKKYTFSKFEKEVSWLLDILWAWKLILVEKEKYIVKKWDNLTKIFRKFNLKKKWISFKQFISFNRLLNYKLRIWQVLSIPKKKYKLLSELSEDKKQKWLKYKLIKKLKEKYVVRSYKVIEDTKAKNEIYILK